MRASGKKWSSQSCTALWFWFRFACPWNDVSFDFNYTMEMKSHCCACWLHRLLNLLFNHFGEGESNNQTPNRTDRHVIDELYVFTSTALSWTIEINSTKMIKLKLETAWNRAKRPILRVDCYLYRVPVCLKIWKSHESPRLYDTNDKLFLSGNEQ